MQLIVRDLNGNTLGRFEVDADRDRVDGLSTRLSDDGGTILVTVTLDDEE